MVGRVKVIIGAASVMPKPSSISKPRALNPRATSSSSLAPAADHIFDVSAEFPMHGFEKSAGKRPGIDEFARFKQGAGDEMRIDFIHDAFMNRGIQARHSNNDIDGVFLKSRNNIFGIDCG
jgi:hypothetical protein